MTVPDMKASLFRVCAAVLVSVVLAGCNRSPEARRDSFMAKGKALMKEKEFSRAMLEFRNAAQAMPKEAEPFYQMGLGALGANDLQTAASAFRHAVDLNPNHTGAQLKLSQMMATVGDDSLLEDAEKRLKGLAADPETLRTLAFTELRLGNFDEAAEAVQRVLAGAPGELVASVLLARARLGQKDPQGAEAILKEAVKRAPGSANAHTILAEFYIARNRLPEAETELRAALAIDAKAERALVNLARLQFSAGRKQEAEQSFQQLSNLGSAKSIYGAFLFREGRRDEAVAEFERLVKANPDDRALRTSLVAMYKTVNRPQDADRLLGAALQKNPKDGDALLQRAEILLAGGKFAEAEADLNRVRELMPSAPEVHYVLAKLNQARGNSSTYRQELTETLRLNPLLRLARVELARNLVNANQAQAALDLLNAAPDAQKYASDIVVQRIWAYWGAGKMPEMRKELDAALARERSMDFLVQDAMWNIRAGKPAAARARLEEALRIDPADLRALSILMQTYDGKSQASMAVQKIGEYAARQPASAPIQHLLGTALMAKGDRAAARAAFAKAQAADPSFVNATLSLIQLDMAENKTGQARASVEKVVAANAKNTTARWWLANLQLMQGDRAASLENYRAVVEADPRNSDALNNLAYLLSEDGQQLDEALKYAQKALELAPESADYCDTMGWILYRKGVYSSAVKYLERASSKNSNPVVRYHLGMAYAKAGDLTRGRAVLTAALKLNPALPEAKLAQLVLDEAR